MGSTQSKFFAVLLVIAGALAIIAHTLLKRSREVELCLERQFEAEEQARHNYSKFKRAVELLPGYTACQEFHWQECDRCEKFSCCDNTNPKKPPQP